MQQALRGRLARVPAPQQVRPRTRAAARVRPSAAGVLRRVRPPPPARLRVEAEGRGAAGAGRSRGPGCRTAGQGPVSQRMCRDADQGCPVRARPSGSQEGARSEEHTSELQSLMRISYAVFCLKKKNSRQLVTTRRYTK